MKNESNEILNDLLASWHRWAQGYQHATGINSSAMFKDCRSNHRQWASLDELAEEDKSKLEAMDVIINGDPKKGKPAMEPMEYRIALRLQAQNLCTGRSVWTSSRLPKDVEMRAHILANARVTLTFKLQSAGIL